MNREGKKLVLLAEDHVDTRSMLKFMLERCGYGIIEAYNGDEAISQALEQHPDLILMDIAMPGLDGIQATSEIRKIQEISEIPIVGITAQTDEYIEDALDAGYNQIIRKPIDWDALEPLLTNYLGAR